ITVDSAGNVYVADTGNSRIQKFSNPFLPGAPTDVFATAGNGQATVSFTPPASDGGSPIGSYTVTSNPDNITATSTASPITITGLTNGQAYTFTVTATNAAGTGPASTASAGVTPNAASQAGVWIVHAVNGSVVDWDALQHGVVVTGGYLKMNGTFFYISNSGEGYPNGTTPPGYNWAYLQACDQDNGTPLLSNGFPVWASLSGIAPGTA